VALLFVCHPLQTQAVTYLIQRFVPLATFFYLAALVLYVLFRRASSPVSLFLTYALSLTAAVLAMESKEIAFTLPLMIILVEFMFFGGAIAARCFRLLPFILTMAIIPLKLMHLQSQVKSDKTESLSAAMNLVNFGGISTWDYLMTQFGVITTYIRLLLLPIGQNLDYDYPLQQVFLKPDVLFPLALLLIIVGTGLYLLTRSKENPLNKIVAFGIFWFFITLSVESSIVPIEDLIFEHRAYLPSIGFFSAVLAGGALIFNRFSMGSMTRTGFVIIPLGAIVLGLSAATIARNRVWQDEVHFWEDAAGKSPDKPRVHVGLGEALIRKTNIDTVNDTVLAGKMLMKEGSDKNIQAAVNAYNEAIRLGPDLWVVYLKLAEALMLQKKYGEALTSVSTALRLQPKSSKPNVTRGEIFEAKGEIDLARQEYHAAVKKEPLARYPHMKLADMYANEGNYQAARKELEFLLRVYPDKFVRSKLLKLKDK
jgi:tetratricopeptide (TPR) repeat protein